ncbi:hypothetical protein SAY87_023330 [Trapa incisa]|uniref:Uncharacterized protein n=1 Tax=Trapa incisa TaxID=236973 RepID=A0AAN7K7Z7_9MYRT|nr:hypothetical protein SAY87_023330 [Trapa incisa]
MTDQRQMFRFRIPWLSVAPRPAPPPPPPSPPSPAPQPQFRRPPGLASPLQDRAWVPSSTSPRDTYEAKTITSSPSTPPQTPPPSRIRTSFLLSPPPPRVTAAPSERPTPSSQPPASRFPPVLLPPPPPSSPPPPPPPPQYQESKEPSPNVTEKHPTSAKNVSETAPRTNHPIPPPEPVKDTVGEGKEEKKSSEKSKGPSKGSENTQKIPKHHQEVSREEKRKARKSIPSTSHRNHYAAPAGSSSLSSSSFPSIAQEPPSLQKLIKEDVTKMVHKLTSGHPMKSQPGQSPVHVITLAGENQGALMQLSPESLSGSEDGPIHIRRGYKADPDENIDLITDGGEQETPEAALSSGEEDEAAEAHNINSNVQGVNNSVILEGSITERNPGVHVTVLVDEEVVEEPPVVEKEEQQTDTRRSEFSPTPAEKLTYQPNYIRRRCLRGLFMESSESDTDDPAKPRRHGCRYDCFDKTRNKDINIL